MADVKISALPSATTRSDTDALPISQGSATNKITYSQLKSDISSAARWRTVPSGSFTALPTSTSTFVAADTTGLVVGSAVRYAQGGSFRYAICTAISGTTVTINGALMTTGVSITSLAYGSAGMVTQLSFSIVGLYGASTTTTLLATLGKTYFRWKLREANCVSVSAVHRVADTGTEPKVNVLFGGNRVLTEDSNLGVQLSSTGGTWVANTNGQVSATNYVLSYDEVVELEVTAAGSTGDAADLTVVLTLVFTE